MTYVNSQALAARERQVRRAKLAMLLAIAGAVAALVGGAAVVDEPSAGGVVALLCGVAATAAGAAGARHLGRTVRYRITTPNASLRLAATTVACVAGFVVFAVVANSLDLPSAPRSLIVLAVVGGLSLMVTRHERRTTLFQGDATGLRFAQATVRWPEVAWVTVGPGAPGAAVIRAGLGEGRVAAVQVPAADVDGNRLAWVLAQSGRHVPLRFETRTSPPVPPPVAPGQFRYS